jgi:penicillin-binding protein 1A
MTAEQVTGADAIDAAAVPVEAASGADEPSPAPRRPTQSWRQSRWLRRSRWWRRVRWSAVVIVLVVVGGRAAAWALTPPVADARQRVQAMAAAHGGSPLATALPERIATAVLAVEDHRFYSHHGVDTLALPRIAGGVFTGQDAGGATIEVQLAKWLYTGGQRSHIDQVEQVVLAQKLDLHYAKQQILLMYLNTVYFGHGYYGITAACLGYFHLSPDQVDWPQAALLAGLLKAPNAYDPRDHPAAALQRRAYALRRLAVVGAITATQEAAAQRSDLELAVP